MATAAKQLREFIETLDELDVIPTPGVDRVRSTADSSHIPVKKKSNIVPGTPNARLQALIINYMDEIFRKMADMEKQIDPVLREELEGKILELVAFAKNKLQ